MNCKALPAGLIIAGLFILPLQGYSADYGEAEGKFTNTGSEALYCFKDIDTDTPNWTICYTMVQPGQSCRADAIGNSLNGHVFKIPNRTEFFCAAPLKCEAANKKSWVVLQLAKIKNRGGYEDMSWQDFYSRMTGDLPKGAVPIRACSTDWQPLPYDSDLDNKGTQVENREA